MHQNTVKGEDNYKPNFQKNSKPKKFLTNFAEHKCITWKKTAFASGTHFNLSQINDNHYIIKYTCLIYYY